MTEFEISLNKHGGRLNYSNFPKQLYVTYDAIISRARTSLNFISNQFPRINKIEFDIIDNYEFNAFATGANGNYFIGINRGTIASLLIIFQRMLADKEFIPQIGNIDDEFENLPLMENITMNYADMVNNLDFFKPPQNEDRYYYSSHLSKLALDFILAHEISHIIHGHVDYLNSHYSLNIDELHFCKTTDTELNRLLKTLELDADQGATRTLLSSELNKFLGKLEKPEKLKGIYENVEFILQQFSIVATTIFKIFGDQRLDNNTFEMERYPKPRLRNLISLLQIPKIEEYIDVNSSFKFETMHYNIPNAASNGFEISELAFERITGKTSNNLSKEDAWGIIGRNQINILYQYWNSKLMKSLQNYSYINLEQKSNI